MIRKICCCIILIGLVFSACKKEQLLTSQDARIGTSSDSIYFDTVFTQALSITQSFRIYNENDQKLKLSSISLSGGESSVFSINVNGEAGPVVTGIEIAAHDSIHVFVRTSLAGTPALQPFIIEDSILIKWNNNSRAIKVSAWGQNARYIKNGLINTTTTWDNNLPYVILGPLKIEAAATLYIKKGTQVYCHADATILVDGSLETTGDTAYKDRVVFTGDRLDEPYKNYPASWPGIYFSNASKNNKLAYTIIRNAYQGIITEGHAAGPEKKILLDQCIIENIWDAGLLAVNSSVQLNNCLISNCGKNVQLVNGGDYAFTNCTIASYSNLYITHKDPVVFLTDAISINGIIQTAPLKAIFTNSICWGDGALVQDEVLAIRQGNSPFSVRFSYGLWQVSTTTNLIETDNMLNNADPLFELTEGEPLHQNFRLGLGSPALEAGAATTLSVDLDGKPRIQGFTDLGAFEKQ